VYIPSEGAKELRQVSLLAEVQPGVRLYDRRTGRERLIHAVEARGQVVFLSFRNPQTGAIDRQPFSLAEVEDRFEILFAETTAFHANSEIVSLVAEAHRLEHAYLFNPLFATETSLIDLLPHQLAAVYGVPPTPDEPRGRPGLLDHARLRFLLADDAGAGKTVMAGLVIREMLLRRQVKRVLIVPPAGLVGNWERELRNLFRLRFRILSGADARHDNPFADPRNDLAIVSVDTLWRDAMREAYLAAPPYDLVVLDEAHKLSARRETDLTIHKSRRYEMAEQIAAQGRHLLLLTATPHMGKDEPYYLLWRLLEPELLSTPEAFRRLSPARKRRHLLRRMKEEMVRFDGTPIYPPRESRTIEYPLIQGEGHEQDLYDQTTAYCETHYDRARLRNRSAAGLAMSILQRRLASSTWALFKSLERRAEKLETMLDALESGLLSMEELEARQADLPTQDVRDVKTGDEEESEEGLEESERLDEEVLSATEARTIEELRTELAEVQRLVRLARQVYDRKQESKFERLWEVLEDYPDTKVLIFTEFRDTLEFLVARLEGKGLTGKIAQIHGGMGYSERDRQAAFFRDPDGARVMVATDAAGEGINLQFCWLLINYDIPWNPARIEQRMGRVHRYKQEHDVLLLNLVAAGTREGRVLKVLLDKLENIRRELGNDKVFDIIGRQFKGKSLADLIFEAVVAGKEEETQREIEQTLDRDQVQATLADLERTVEVSQVRALLRALQDQREVAEMRRMMPAYVRRFFQYAAPLVGIGIRGDVDDTFALDPCPPGVARALALYPEAVRDRLTFQRKVAMPDLAQDPAAIYLHPGEPVFEAVMDLFLGRYEHEGMRGAVFFDAEAEEPYLFYLVRSQVLRDPTPEGGEPEVVEEQMIGVRRFADGRMEQAPAHGLLTLYGARKDETSVVGQTAEVLDLAADTTAVEAYLVETLGLPALEARRQQEEEQLPQLRKQLQVAYNLRQAELFRQRRLLKEAVDKGIPAARTKLRNCQAELDNLDRHRRQAEAALYDAVDRLRLGPVNLYVQALVLALPPAEAERRRDVQAEQIALREVIGREKAEGSELIEDVSDPHLKAGFDLKILRADGSIRYVEVKGRSGAQAVEMTENEWAQAANHRDRYWLYVVYHCDTVPQLYRVPDPFGRLLTRQTGAVRINARDVMAAAEKPHEMG
jgi:superfamily II DNA or RNA helicase